MQRRNWRRRRGKQHVTSTMPTSTTNYTPLNVANKTERGISGGGEGWELVVVAVAMQSGGDRVHIWRRWSANLVVMEGYLYLMVVVVT